MSSGRFRLIAEKTFLVVDNQLVIHVKGSTLTQIEHVKENSTVWFVFEHTARKIKLEKKAEWEELVSLLESKQ
jgi:hypothetical protein